MIGTICTAIVVFLAISISGAMAILSEKDNFEIAYVLFVSGMISVLTIKTLIDHGLLVWK